MASTVNANKTQDTNHAEEVELEVWWEVVGPCLLVKLTLLQRCLLKSVCLIDFKENITCDVVIARWLSWCSGTCTITWHLAMCHDSMPDMILSFVRNWKQFSLQTELHNDHHVSWRCLHTIGAKCHQLLPWQDCITIRYVTMMLIDPFGCASSISSFLTQ